MKRIYIVFTAVLVSFFVNCNGDPVVVHLQYSHAPDALHVKITLKDGTVHEGTATKNNDRSTLRLDMVEYFPSISKPYDYTLYVQGLDIASHCVISEGQLMATYNPTPGWGQDEDLALIDLPMPKCE